MTKAAAERQVIVTWYTPEEKLPPDDECVVVTFSGNYGLSSYIHALGLAWYYKGEGWAIDDMGEEESDAMTIEAWCDLDAYGISSTADTKLN